MTLNFFHSSHVILFAEMRRAVVGDSEFLVGLTVLCNIHTEYLPVNNKFDITTPTIVSLWPVIFIARQHTMHAERDIVLPIRLSAQCQYVSIVTLFDILVGESFQFLCPTTVKKFQWEPFSRASC